MEALADAVGLRALGFGARVINVLDREIELVLVPLRIAAILATAVGQYPQQLDIMAIEEGNHPVVQQISRCDRRFTIVELGASDLGVGVDDPSIPDQPYCLKLELPRKPPSLHDPPPAPSKHLTRCLWNRVQATILER